MLVGSLTPTCPVWPLIGTPNGASVAGSTEPVEVVITRRVFVILSACNSMSPPDWINADELLIRAAFVYLPLASLPPANTTLPIPKMAVVAIESVAVVPSRFSMSFARISSAPLLSDAPISAVGPTFATVPVALSDTLPPTIAPVLVRLPDCVCSNPPADSAPELTMLPALTFRSLTDCTLPLLSNVPGNANARS
ncbi:Uncharacterised protein [Burkholderia pseudomallei]|nr:Uncharacterised protein [Burkholderia pseudomallei]